MTAIATPALFVVSCSESHQNGKYNKNLQFYFEKQSFIQSKNIEGHTIANNKEYVDFYSKPENQIMAKYPFLSLGTGIFMDKEWVGTMSGPSIIKLILDFKIETVSDDKIKYTLTIDDNYNPSNTEFLIDFENGEMVNENSDVISDRYFYSALMVNPPKFNKLKTDNSLDNVEQFLSFDWSTKQKELKNIITLPLGGSDDGNMIIGDVQAAINSISVLPSVVDNKNNIRLKINYNDGYFAINQFLEINFETGYMSEFISQKIKPSIDSDKFLKLKQKPNGNGEYNIDEFVTEQNNLINSGNEWFNKINDTKFDGFNIYLFLNDNIKKIDENTIEISVDIDDQYGSRFISSNFSLTNKTIKINYDDGRIIE